MRRGRRGHLVVIVLRQQLIHHRDIPPTLSDVEHRADQESHHMMQKAISLDVESETAFAFPPGGACNSAMVCITLRCGTLHGERAKAMFALDRAGRVGHPPKIERPRPNQLSGASKRG